MGWRLTPSRRARVGSQTDGDTAYEPPDGGEETPPEGEAVISYTILPLALLMTVTN